MEGEWHAGTFYVGQRAMGMRNNIVRDGRVDCLHFHASDLRVHLSIPCQNLMIQQNFLFKLKLYCGFSVIKLTGLCLNNKCLVLGRSGPELTSSFGIEGSLCD